jgi:hypothetical protein
MSVEEIMDYVMDLLERVNADSLRSLSALFARNNGPGEA